MSSIWCVAMAGLFVNIYFQCVFKILHFSKSHFEDTKLLAGFRPRMSKTDIVKQILLFHEGEKVSEGAGDGGALFSLFYPC